MGISQDTEKTNEPAAPGRSRRRNGNKMPPSRERRKIAGFACSVLLLVMVVAAGVYGWMGQKYQEVFLSQYHD